MKNTNITYIEVSICLIGILLGMLLTLLIQEYKNINTILQIKQCDEIYYSHRMPELNHKGLYTFYDFTKNKNVVIVGSFSITEVLKVNTK